MIRSKYIIVLGESGRAMYGENGKSQHSVIKDLAEHSGHVNIHYLTESGAQPAVDSRCSTSGRIGILV